MIARRAAAAGPCRRAGSVPPLTGRFDEAVRRSAESMIVRPSPVWTTVSAANLTRSSRRRESLSLPRSVPPARSPPRPRPSTADTRRPWTAGVCRPARVDDGPARRSGVDRPVLDVCRAGCLVRGGRAVVDGLSAVETVTTLSLTGLCRCRSAPPASALVAERLRFVVDVTFLLFTHTALRPIHTERVYVRRAMRVDGRRRAYRPTSVDVRLHPSTDVNALKIEHGSILSASTSVDGRRRAWCEWAYKVVTHWKVFFRKSLSKVTC